MRTKITLGLAAGAAAWCALGGSAYAGGFQLRAFDAKATGMSQAFTAVADNAAAASYNPAGMSQLDGIQASLTMTMIKPLIHFEPDNPLEGEANSISETSIAPSLNVTFQITDYLHLGLGVIAPFGTNVEYRNTWSGRYIATHTQIKTLQMNPSLAFTVPGMPEGMTLALAAGFGVTQTDVRLKQNIDFSATGGNDAFVKLTGDTNNHLRLNWNAAIHATFADRLVRVGAYYKSATQNNVIHGDAYFTNVPLNPVTQQPALPSKTRGRTELNIPDTLNLGVAINPIEPLILSVEFTWTNWSRLQNVYIDFQDLNTRSTIPLNWNDTYYYGLGAEYAVVKDTFFVRGGIYYDQSPTRMETVSPSIPDNHRKGFSLGLGFNPIENIQLDLSYAAVFLSDLTKRNQIGATSVDGGTPRADGIFETYAHVIAFTVGIWF